MTLWDNIIKKLIKENLDFYPDIRYLQRHFIMFPHCFPKYMLNDNYKIFFNHKLLRYEIYKI